MKRHSRILTRLLRRLLYGGVIGWLLIAPAQAAEVAARVQFVFGEVAVIGVDGDRRSLRRGDEIFPGDTLESATASAAQLVFRDNSRMAVRANTVVRIEDYHFDADDYERSSSFIALLKGAVRSVTGLIGRYAKPKVVMVTPVATIGIRGTDYEVIHLTADSAVGDGLTGTYNKVYSGATLLRSARGELPLDPGQVGFVAGTPGVAAAPVLIDALPDAVAEMLAQALPVRVEPGLGDAVAARELLDGLLAGDAVALDLNATELADSVNRAGATASQAAGGSVGNATGALGGAAGGIGGQLPGGGALSVPLNTNQIELP